MPANTAWINSNSTRHYPFLEGVTLQERFSVGGTLFTLPFNWILDLVLTGTREAEIVGATAYNIDYFVHSITRTGSTDILLSIREIQREVYNEFTPSTYRDVGTFTIPFGTLPGTEIIFASQTGVDIRGKLTTGEPLDTKITVGSHEFLPSATTLEYSTCVPYPGDRGVTSLSVLGDATTLTGDVTLREGVDADVYIVPEDNAIRVDFNQDIITCVANDGECIDTDEDICDQPALMRVNGVPGNSAFNLIITGGNAINVSALTVPPEGGDPFDPSTFITRGVVITYSGPVYSKALVEGSSDPNDYTYGLDCALAGGQELVDSLNDDLNSLENDMQVLRNSLP